MMAVTAVARAGVLFWCCNHLYSATVQGTVINVSGEPIAAASVEVVNPYKPETGILDYVRSDVNGHFKKEGLTPGQYMVFASKPQDGYGDTRIAMFAVGLKIPELAIHTTDEVVDVEVNIGSRGGYLNGSVLDAQDSSPVTGAHVKVVLETAPDKYMSFGVGEQGNFTVLVPARPIIVTVRAPGYEDQQLSLSLSEAERIAIRVTLKRRGVG